MKNSYRNIFLLIGVIAIIIMLFTFDMKYDELLDNLKRAGFLFPIVVLLWVFIYLINALSWYMIIHDNESNHVPFLKVYKFTVTGFALNYATPFGFMGGEPYRVMELTPYVGVSKATSSVILYIMMHIFAHFCFWLSSIFLFLLLYPVNLGTGIMLTFAGAFCLFFIYLFSRGYKNGMAVKALRLCTKIPFLKKWAVRFAEEKKETLELIDSQIAELHKQRKKTFYASLCLEFTTRIIGCLEVFLILRILTPDVNFLECILIMAFTSLLSNLFFFLPMQLGVREGGFALATGGLALTGAFGIYTGLIIRIRELIWIGIGMMLMKVGNKNNSVSNKNNI